jgi:hypothetical protein
MSYIQNILKSSSTCENGTEEAAINKLWLVLDVTQFHATQQKNFSHSDKEYYFC